MANDRNEARESLSIALLDCTLSVGLWPQAHDIGVEPKGIRAVIADETNQWKPLHVMDTVCVDVD